MILPDNYKDGSFRVTLEGSCDFYDDFLQLKDLKFCLGVDAESGRLFSSYGIYIDYYFDVQKGVLYMTSSWLDSYGDLLAIKEMFLCIVDRYVIANMHINLEFIYYYLTEHSLINIVRTVCANEELHYVLTKAYNNEAVVLQNPKLHVYLKNHAYCLKVLNLKQFIEEDDDQVCLFDLSGIFKSPHILNIYLGRDLKSIEALVVFFSQLLNYAIKVKKTHGRIKNKYDLKYFRSKLNNIELSGELYAGVRKQLYKLFNEGYCLKEVAPDDSSRNERKERTAFL